MFGFNGLVTSEAAKERFPHKALRRRLMGFAVKQASGGPKEAMDEIQKIICEKACMYATTILGTIDKINEADKEIYQDAWTTNQDGLECFEDLFHIAGNLIEAAPEIGPEIKPLPRRVVGEPSFQKWRELQAKLDALLGKDVMSKMT